MPDVGVGALPYNGIVPVTTSNDITSAPSRTTCVVVGAGHAGLSMSRRLTDRSIDHVVVERGQIADAWLTQRWPSLRLLTPNWQLRLPGAGYEGDDPDGFMSAAEVGHFVRDYARSIDSPVVTGTTVTAVVPDDDGYTVATDRGRWSCAAVVVASGAASRSAVPALADAVPAGVASISPLAYRGPDQLDGGGVLVVGASATGVQLADEIRRSGREVTLSVGEHVRLPRTYRGRDIFWWLDAAGVLDERHDAVDDLVRARHVPSPQLIGSPEHRPIDLGTLRSIGVEVVGRLGAVRDGVCSFSGGLANSCALADLKMDRLLGRFDDWAQRTAAEVDRPPHRFAPTIPAGAPGLELDLRRRGIGTVVWATGFRPDHSWLRVPSFDRGGRLRHDGGVVCGAAGVYVLGGNLLRRRRSSYIAGASDDTSELAAHLHRHLDATRRRAARHA